MKNRFKLPPWLRRLVDRLPNIEPVVLAVLALGITSVWGFIEIAEEVLEGDTQAFDHWMLRVLRNPENPAEPLGPPWFQEMGRDATAAGGIAWLSFITVVVAVYL